MMYDSQRVTALTEQPCSYFSIRREFFFSVQRHTLRGDIPCCFESVRVRAYVTGGKGFVRINGVDFPLQAGCLCLFHPFHVFEFFSDEQSPLEVMLLVHDYALDAYLIIRDYSERDSELFNFCPVLPLSGKRREDYEETLFRFEEERNTFSVSSATIKIALLGQLMTMEKEYQRRSGTFHPPLGWRILVFTTKFDTQKITAAMVADHFSITTAAVNRELRKITTYGFNDNLSRARIVAACSLLPLNGLSTSYIAKYLNFSSEKGFYRAFHKWQGMTPQQYRDSYPSDIFGYVSGGISDLPYAIVTYIHKNYLLPITISTAAKELYISEKAINSLLKEYTDLSFQEHLTQRRLRYAKGLLRTSPLLISDIAMESGFSATNTFCRVFKSNVGMTAGEYREAFRRKQP